MRIIIVANRLPVNIEEKGEEIVFKESPGGLVSSLSYLLSNFKIQNKKVEALWVGWPGKTVQKKNQTVVAQRLKEKYKSIPVFLTEEQVSKYYLGFSNKTIWPLFHYFSDKSEFDAENWESYKQVNKHFFDNLTKIIESGDIVFVQDYQLMLLPQMLREKYPDMGIGFFMHIPFPSYELFRILPENVRKGILTGLLGSDMVGFHINDYAQHFFENVEKILGITHDSKVLEYNDRSIHVEHIPLGINFNKYSELKKSSKIKKRVRDLRKSIGTKHILFSVDRLDYTKGINNRLLGYEIFLHKNPNFHKKVTLILNAQPSRIEIDDYQSIKEEVDKLVGRINGEFGDIDWTPIIYQFNSLDFSEMLVRYLVSDIAMVTPLRDGMNLVSKEFIAARTDKKGVLILSETAGSAKELTQAILINPNNPEEISDAIKEALKMGLPEQKRRMSQMIKNVSTITSDWWARECIERLVDIHKVTQTTIPLMKNSVDEKKLISDYAKSEKRLILMDYDGTLVPLVLRPELATPPKKLLTLLKNLSDDFRNEVVITSGRDKDFLEKWFNFSKMALVAEHGMWLKERNQFYFTQTKNISNEWTKKLAPILKKYSSKVPHSFVEEKHYSLVWHYRMSDKQIVKQFLPDLLDEVKQAIENTTLEIIEGNSGIEIKDASIHKGDAATAWLSKKKYDFILALGDDKTDENLFQALPPEAYKIRVGDGSSVANYRLKNSEEVNELINKLVNSKVS